MSDLVGKSIGRYHLREQLGEGGMATVYKAYDTRLEREVAVKFIRKDAFPPNQLEVTLKRFEREAKALARLSHLNIVKVYDYGEYEDAPYLVEEYLPGGTLKQRLGKPMPWQEAVRLLLPVARALEYAHRQGMVHRDVKPSNILITSEGAPMLTDFGIAKLLAGEETQNLTGTGIGIGTPEYMAPEQWTGALGPGLDIYSLGVVLYELVTGRKPYTADTPAAILLKQVNDPLPSPNQFVPDLPEAVDRFLLKALAKKPEDRYQNMGEVVKALDGLLVGQPLPLQPQEKTFSVQPVGGNAPSGLGQAVPVERTVEPTIPEVKGSTLPRPATSKKRPWMIAGGIGGILLLLIAGVFWALVSLKKQAASTPLAAVPSVAVMTDTSFPTMITAPTLTSALGLLPMSAADLAAAPQAATLYEQDFEGGTITGLHGGGGNWSVVRENNGNHIYCNASSTNWQSFTFGNETWTDYLLQMRVEFLGQSVGQDQQVNALMRLNSNEDGYNAGLGNMGAWLNYQPGNRDLANAPISAAANQWYIFQVAAYGSQLEFSIDGQRIGTASDTARLNGMLGFVVSPNTQACVDDIHVWALKSEGSFGP
jgi:serine/threonine protein kinase